MHYYRGSGLYGGTLLRHTTLWPLSLIDDMIYRLFRLSWYISVHSKMYTLSGFLTTDNVIIEEKGENLLLFSSQIV